MYKDHKRNKILFSFLFNQRRRNGLNMCWSLPFPLYIGLDCNSEDWAGRAEMTEDNVVENPSKWSVYMGAFGWRYCICECFLLLNWRDCLGGQWCLYCWVWPICSLLPGNQQKGGSRILPFLLPCCWNHAWGLPAQWSADFVDQTVNIWCRHLTFVVVQDEFILPSSHSFCFFSLCFKSMNHLYNCFVLPGINKKLIWNTL